MFERLKTEPYFLNCVITGNENWFFKYDPETKVSRDSAVGIATGYGLDD
jgi:hypothetical protein